jgi:hypothetical protein
VRLPLLVALLALPLTWQGPAQGLNPLPTQYEPRLKAGCGDSAHASVARGAGFVACRQGVSERSERQGALPEPLSEHDRMALPHLERVHEDVQRLRSLPRTLPSPGRFQDIRAVLHAHSRLSHDSRGTSEEIIAAAKKAGVKVIFMTDHYTPDRRFLREALRGTRDGILFIPGAELSQGLLTFRMEKAEWPEDAGDAGVLKALNAAGGMGFVAHPELRKEWDLPFAGMEIYNTHADAEDNVKEGLPALRGTGGLVAWLPLVEAAQRYPRELFASIFDPPAANLAVWDRLNRTRRVVGIAGNDSHQNVGVTVFGAEGGRLEVIDALGKVLARPRAGELPSLLFPGGVVPGQPLIQLRLDPYDVSFGYVSTHLMAPAITEAACFEALTHGRCYVAFDWIADPTGFRFTGRAGRRRLEMGDQVEAREVRLVAAAPLPAEIRLLRDGREIARESGTRLETTVREPGVYRAEVWLTVAGEGRAWIYSNPIYLR